MSSAPPPIDRAVVNALRRQPPGDRVLVYVDHSTLSELALGEKPEFVELLRLLERAVESGRLICPYSPEHRDEAALAQAQSYDAIDKLGDVLAIGIEFLGRELIEWHEIYAAARAFLGQEPQPLWKEAFREDPHTPREELFFEFMGGQIRVKARFPVDEDQRAEVLYEKAKEDPMVQAYDELRAAGFSFEEMAEANTEAMLDWKLGPLFDPEGFYAAVERRKAELVSEWATTSEANLAPGSPTNRYLTFAIRMSQTKAFVERFPELLERSAEFRTSSELRSLPTLRYPALLRAALAADPNDRKARRSDGYDIEHLTIGLSRCAIVTADRSMTLIARERDLIPDGCQLFEFRDVSGLTSAVELALGG
jgi:hypothetical protein